MFKPCRLKYLKPCLSNFRSLGIEVPWDSWQCRNSYNSGIYSNSGIHSNSTKQVVPDLSSALALACEQKEVAEAVKQLKDCSKQWLKRRVGEPLPKKKGKPKVHRRKSYQWLVAVDNALRAISGKGLKDFQITEEELANPSSPLEWPLLMGVADKGPDGVCSVNYCRKLRINMDMFWDGSHGAWGGGRDGIQAAGLGTHVFLMNIAYNAGHGEWKDGTRYEQIKDATILVTKALAPDDNLAFQTCLPGMLQIRDMDRSWIGDPNLPRDFYEYHQDGGPWCSLDQRVGMSRFFGCVKRFEEKEAMAWR